MSTKRPAHFDTSLPSSKRVRFEAFEHEKADDDIMTTPMRAVSFEGEGTTYKHETTAQRIFTFTADNNELARLQLLSTHTIYDLVSSLCQHTPVGYGGGEGPNDHLWYVAYNGEPLRAYTTKLESLSLEKGETLVLAYDYGNTSTYRITLIDIEEMSNKDDVASFPRNQPTSGPVSGLPLSYQKYQLNTGGSSLLDGRFFDLNEWIFNNAGQDLSVNLFQAGRKKNYGFLNDGFTMMYLPAKPNDLANWLECFNRCAAIKPAGLEAEGYHHYTWQSVVALPRARLTPQLEGKYKSNERLGFCDAPIVEDHSLYPSPLTVNLDQLFPKIAALAGLRKDKKVPKGWISYTKRGNQCNLRVCNGNARDPKKSKSPKGLAFEGENQHNPVESPLFEVSGGLDIRGLDDLFCVVEGLLRTLG